MSKKIKISPTITVEKINGSNVLDVYRFGMDSSVIAISLESLKKMVEVLEEE